MKPKIGWGITTGLAGHEQQVLGILEELVEQPDMIVVTPRGPSKWLAPRLPPNRDPKLTPPWPDIVVTAGRQSASYARWVAKQSGGKTFSVVLQDPRASYKAVDFLWVNEHDKAAGANVMRTLTAPHRVTLDRLSADAKSLATRISPLPGPYIGLVLGGPNKVYGFTAQEARNIADNVAKLAKDRGASVLVTPSRRTGESRLDAVRAGLSNTPHWVWDPATQNPYFGILGLADEIVVTCDSTNMLGEATVTGKPLHMARLKGKGGKFADFHTRLIEHGAAHWLDEMWEPWTYTAINSRDAIVSEIVRRYDLKMRSLKNKP